VPREVSSCLYECLRELLNNVSRHAEAERAAVFLECWADELRLVVRDDGKGFDAEAVTSRLTPEGGFGLCNIRDRVDALGGTLWIDSRPGEGTRVEVRMPLTTRPEPVQEGGAP